MSDVNPNEYFRAWMDRPHQDPMTELLTDEYADGVRQFMAIASIQENTLQTGKLYCPCTKCRNRRYNSINVVWNHLYMKGFMSGYKIWYLHGENESMVNFGSTSANYGDDRIDDRTTVNQNVGTVQMVNDAFREHGADYVHEQQISVEEPNYEARKFFDMLSAAKNPLYKGCREGDSPLSAATRLMNIKTDFNLSEDCVDAIADYVKNILPEDNLAPASYYEIQKLVSGLGLPYQMIDVCIDNCMIYWRRDEDRSSCRFCRKPRYKETNGRVPIPYKRMWYLPLTDRLKRLYQSERTTTAMRWHAEHISDGEIVHPSDAEA